MLIGKQPLLKLSSMHLYEDSFSLLLVGSRVVDEIMVSHKLKRRIFLQ